MAMYCILWVVFILPAALQSTGRNMFLPKPRMTPLEVPADRSFRHESRSVPMNFLLYSNRPPIFIFTFSDARTVTLYDPW